MKELSFQTLIILICAFKSVLSDSSEPLHLTPLLQKGKILAARDYSLVKDKDCIIPTSYSGFITVDHLLGNHLFFWFFPAINSTPKAPLLVWLNGGPGVPSSLGLFHENGPLKFKKSDDGHVGFERRNNSWAETFSMLYIDNPVGVGYSYSDSGEEGYRTSQDGYSKDLFEFIQQFYTMFPEYLQRELYIGGQSYAGKYVPAFAYRIHEEIQANRSKIPLTGIYLGGPLIDLEIQSPIHADLYYSLGYISDKQRKDFEIKAKKHLNEVISGRSVFLQDRDMKILFNLEVCQGCWDNLHNLEMPPYNNVYKVMKAMHQKVHTGKTKFEFNEEVRQKLSSDFFASTKVKLGELMDNYKVLLFTSDQDGVISSPMVEAALMSTPWSLQSKYNNAYRLIWASQDKSDVKGFYTHIGQFCRVTIRGAGHQVPYDQPENTLLMMTAFIRYGCVS